MAGCSGLWDPGMGRCEPAKFDESFDDIQFWGSYVLGKSHYTVSIGTFRSRLLVSCPVTAADAEPFFFHQR